MPRLIYIRAVTNRDGSDAVSCLRLRQRSPPCPSIPTQNSPPGGARRSSSRVAPASASPRPPARRASAAAPASRCAEQVRRGPLRPEQPPAQAGETPRRPTSRSASARRGSSMLLAPLGLAAATGVPARTCARLRRALGAAQARRRRPRDRGGAPPRPRHARSLQREEPPASSCTSTSRRSPAYPTAAAGAPSAGAWIRRAFRRWFLAPARRRRRLQQGRLRRAAAPRRRAPARRSVGRLLVFAGMGVRVERVMTDNGPGYRSGEFNALLESEERPPHVHAALQPLQNGKVERMNRTLAQEWQYGRAWECERAEALPAYIRRSGSSAQRVRGPPPCRASSVLTTYWHTTASGLDEASVSVLNAIFCTCFIERGQNLTIDRGYEARIASDTCMYISSFEQLRKNILSRQPSCVLSTREGPTHIRMCLDANAGWVLYNAFVEGVKGSYFKLNQSFAAKEAGLLEALANPDCGWLFKCKPEVFGTMPGNPIAYWASQSIINAFTKGQPISTFAEAKQGLKTADNDTYMRLWFEVGDAKVCHEELGLELAESSSYRWFTHVKGGEFRKWYGNNEYVLDWENGGKRLRAFKKAVLRNTRFAFRENLTWSVISSGRLAMRYTPKGSTFDGTGSCLFPAEVNSGYLQGFLNSSVACVIAAILSPTLTFEVGQIANYPVIFNQKFENAINKLVAEERLLAKSDWDAFETSWDFSRHPLI